MLEASHDETQNEAPARRLRRVIIEERQRKTLEHARLATGYADDIDPHAHNQATFRLINQRKELDALPAAELVVPALDDWKHWTRMNDWDSRNRLLEELTGKMRRREASPAEIQLLVVVCRPAWRAVLVSLRRYGGMDLDPRAESVHQREEARRVNELDRAQLDQVIQHALMDVLQDCPRTVPHTVLPVAEERARPPRPRPCPPGDRRGRHATRYDRGIKSVLDDLLASKDARPRSSSRPHPLDTPPG